MQNGDRENLRIALCGYDGEHDILEGRGWKKVSWAAGGGYGNLRGNQNRLQERIWFNPQCLDPEAE